MRTHRRHGFEYKPVAPRGEYAMGMGGSMRHGSEYRPVAPNAVNTFRLQIFLNI